MPGSPETSITWPSPPLARSQRRSNTSISSSRPTNGVSAEPRKASKRLSTALGRNTCHAGTGAAMPFTSTAPRSPYSNRSPSSRRVVGAMTTAFGSASLQACRQVRRFADDRWLLRRALADQIADDHEPGGDADARRELGRFDIEPANGVHDTQSGPNRSLGIVLMRPRIAEINEYTVTHVFGDKAVEPTDDLGDGVVYAATTSRRSSGSRRADSAVEPTRSQNITVSCRRSASIGGGEGGPEVTLVAD